MADNVVTTSVHHAMSGLYLSPDMAFFSSSSIANLLDDVVQTVIHSRQPLASSYAKFADCAHDRYTAWAQSQTTYVSHDVLMAAYGLASTRYYIYRGLATMTSVACNICLHTLNYPEGGEYSRIIPSALRDMRIGSPTQVGPDTFQRIIATDPWVTWTERLRAQYRRTLRLLKAIDFKLGDALQQHSTEENEWETKEKCKPLHEQPEVRRAIKRAVKLHGRIFHNDDVVRFMNGAVICIDGRLYNYRLIKSHSLLDGMTSNRQNRMAPCHLDIYNKQNKLLAGACLYFYDTSILDYLLNVRLYASNETTEMDMLHAMHMTSTTRAFFADPVLPTLKGIHDPATTPLHVVANLDQYFVNDGENSMCAAYFSEYYSHATTVFNEVVGLPPSYLELLRKLAGSHVQDILEHNEVVKELNAITLESIT